LIQIISATLPLLLGAVIEVPAGADLTAAIAAAKEGDRIRLAAGEHRGSLGRWRTDVRIEGAGAGRTVVIAPEGEDAIVVQAGAVELSGLALRAGGGRAALKVLGGAVRIRDLALAGGACGAYVEGGSLSGAGVELRGGYGLLARSAEVSLDDGSARGAVAGIALLSGKLSLSRFDVAGPGREGGISVSGGEAELRAVVVRAPGPTGIGVNGVDAVVRGTAVDVSGAREVEGGMLGDCLQVRRGRLSLSEGSLTRCGGAALEASAGKVTLSGMSAVGGEAGCLVLVERSEAELAGNTCAGPGPGLVVASGSRAVIRTNRWRTDPALWVECGSGARVEVGPGERVATPCQPGR
jgi:hypothetical protein